MINPVKSKVLVIKRTLKPFKFQCDSEFMRHVQLLYRESHACMICTLVSVSDVIVL